MYPDMQTQWLLLPHNNGCVNQIPLHLLSGRGTDILHLIQYKDIREAGLVIKGVAYEPGPERGKRSSRGLLPPGLYNSLIKTDLHTWRLGTWTTMPKFPLQND